MARENQIVCRPGKRLGFFHGISEILNCTGVQQSQRKVRTSCLSGSHKILDDPVKRALSQRFCCILIKTAQIQ